MGGVNSIANLGLGAQEYASLNAQRKRPEGEAEAAVNAQGQRQTAGQQEGAVQARREAAPEIACPPAKEVPGIMAGLVSGIAQSPGWRLAEIQPAGKSKLVPAAYV